MAIDNLNNNELGLSMYPYFGIDVSITINQAFYPELSENHSIAASVSIDQDIYDATPKHHVKLLTKTLQLANHAVRDLELFPERIYQRRHGDRLY